MARRLQTRPGVRPLTALAFELVIGTAERFLCAKRIASYVGLVSSEESSGDRRRLGHISKQGNSLMRFLLVEKQPRLRFRSHPQWRSQFPHLAMRRACVAPVQPIATTAATRFPASRFSSSRGSHCRVALVASNFQ